MRKRTNHYRNWQAAPKDDKRPTLRSVIAGTAMAVMAATTNAEFNQQLKAATNAGKDLTGIDMSGRTVESGVIAKGAKLTNAKLTATTIKGPLNNVDLSGSWSYGGCEIQGQTNNLNLNGSIHYGLKARSLNNTKASNAIFGMCDFSNASAVNLKAEGTDFFASNMNGMFAPSANLNESSMMFVSMDDANLDKAAVSVEKGPLSARRTTLKYATLNSEMVMAGAAAEQASKITDVGLDFSDIPMTTNGLQVRQNLVRSRIAYSYAA